MGYKYGGCRIWHGPDIAAPLPYYFGVHMAHISKRTLHRTTKHHPYFVRGQLGRGKIPWHTYG